MRFRSVVGPGLQVAGGVACLAGVFLLAGVAWALVAGGVAAVVVGMLHEAGRI